MIDLNAAYAFVAVVREGSFVGAARILGVPRSTISLRVSRLETAVGERLLRRSTRRVALTDAGQRLFGQLDAAIGTVVAALEPAGDAMKGNVRVTLPPEYPQHIIAQAVARVRARYPEITVELVVTNRILDLVAERIDLAVRGGRSGSSGQVAIPLPPVPFGLLASPGYLEGRALPTALNDLSSHRMLPIAGGDGLRLPGLPSELERELLGPGAGACANTMTMLLQLALAGEGIAILPLHLCRAQLRMVR